MTAAAKDTTKKPAPKRKAGKRSKRVKLTAQEEKFCAHYALHQSGADAIRHAYPSWKNKGAQDVARKASKLLSRAEIRERTEALATRASKIAEEKFEITAERVLQELAAIAFANADDYYKWGTFEQPVFRKDGTPVIDGATGQQAKEIVPFVYIKPSDSLTRAQKAAIAGAEMTFSKDGSPMVAVKMADKRAALKDLGQHLKLFGQAPVGVNVTNGTVQLVVSPAENNL